MTLWQAIESLVKQIPFARPGVERALSLTFVESDKKSNEVFLVLEGGGVLLGDGVEIAGVELRIKRSGGHPGFMVLTLAASPCITLEQVRGHYPDLVVTDTPRGRSLDEATYHSEDLSWGRLSFGFAERNRKCLARIVLNPRS